MGLCVGPDDVYLGAARLAHAGRASGAALSVGPESRAMARGSGRRSRACCIRRSRAIPATRSGSAISPAPAGCSASCSSRCPTRRSHAFMNALTPVRHGLFVGRLREPGRFRSTAANTARATQWSPGGPTLRFHIGLEDAGRPDRRSGARLRGDGGGGLDHRALAIARA